MMNDNDNDRDLGPEAVHALRMEEVVLVVLRDHSLGPADRAVLENTVRIARSLQKALRATG